MLSAHKEQQLAAWFRQFGSALIGFSGGVDSAYLACVAVEAIGSHRVLAVIGRSASYPAEQWRRARELAEGFHIPVLEIDTEELADARYASNPSNRCYFCKSELWARLVPVAKQRGLAVVVDGTNADDLSDYRPGRRAATEFHVRSPLAELGFSKEEIRAYARSRDIPTWSVPSSPCLSSRLPYGTPVTSERLRQVEVAETAVRSLGVKGNLRVRYHGELACIELDSAELVDLLVPESLAALAHAVSQAGFRRVCIDLRGFRSGSLNVLDGISA
jgi:pyridinium-3,5-biscarboxylic acid mononucleotide sulfurtransferase